MPGLNEVRIIGNITREVELRHVGANSTAVTEIGVAITERVKRQNEWVEETQFVDVTLWGRLAEVASEYLTKGSQVYIGGKLKLDSWEKDGKRFSKLKVNGESMQMLGGRPKAQQASDIDQTRPDKPQMPPQEEIPF